ncbi:MAG: mannose-6-phosphate isomerase, class I [Acidobacteria bacterium]|nr:mannose-6-phosphate isomerase, class I [Acidobacteriota bacterium]
MTPPVFPLRGIPQHYEWGGYEFIPDLIGTHNRERRPFAELWIGAHPKAPSIALLGEHEKPLQEVLPAPLPYLMKILDARQMLSIQAHPNKAQAEAGFERENSQEIPLNAPQRNYKDANHKPEVHVALTDFWMLHGFRDLNDLEFFADIYPELRALDRSGGVRGVYEAAMTLPQAEVDAILNPLLERLEALPLTRMDPGYWALRAARDFPTADGGRDRGIFCCFLLNLLHLRPGEGTYQPAGVLHAYLEGINVELMANSDNVLRGGLTPKHVDVPELLSILSFHAGPAKILTGHSLSPALRVYRTDAEEFELSCITLTDEIEFKNLAAKGPEALIALEGSARIESETMAVEMERGTIAMVQQDVAYRLETDTHAVIYRAALPG